MRTSLRENALCSLAALAGCLVLAWLGLYGFAWNDYEVEVQPAFEALAHGHVSLFLSLAPAYGGSLVERAPFALLPGLWGGGSLAVYRLVALPCLLASALLAVWLVRDMRTRGASRSARALTIGICAANPITLLALEVGHPEELLGACLCVGAVLLARSRGLTRSGAIGAGALLGLAIANKEWALVAAGPVLLALAPGRRALAGASCMLVAGAVLAPLLLDSSSPFLANARVSASSNSTIFQPWQLGWFLGHHGAAVHGLFGSAKPGYRTGPSWIGPISHPLILLAAGAIAASLWRRARGRSLSDAEALMALALVMLARCLLDTWDTSYYTLPFLLSLLALETRLPVREHRLPVFSLAATGLTWVSFKWLPERASADLQAAFFLAWAAPLWAWLAIRLSAPDGTISLLRHPGGGAAPKDPQETTVSSLGRLVSTS